MAAAHPPVLYNSDLSCEIHDCHPATATTTIVKAKSPLRQQQFTRNNDSPPTVNNKNSQVYSQPSNPSSSSTIITSSSSSTQSLSQQQQVRRNRLYGQAPPDPRTTTRSKNTSSTPSSSRTSLTTKRSFSWPIPTTVKEVQTLYKQVVLDDSNNKQQHLELCNHMMQWIYHLKNEFSTANNNTSGSSANYSDSSLNKPDISLLRDAMETYARNLLRKLSKAARNMDNPGVVREAQFILASCYGSGKIGFTKDATKACAWYIQASKQNHCEGTYRTAVCYELGLGIKQDFNRAITYYHKGARLSHPSCMYRLGVILLYGYYKQTPQPRIAVCWLQRATTYLVFTNNNNSNSNISSNTSSNNCSGNSNSSLFSSFSASFSSSFSLPSSSFSSSSSSLLSSTTGSTCISTGATTNAEALPNALHALAMVQLTGECDKTSLIPDPAYAISLLHRAAKMGYEASQCKLGEFYETGIWVTADDVKSILWYTCAAKQGSPEGALGLSGWYLTGSNTPGVLPQSDRESFLWAKRAANTTIEPRDYYMGEKPIRLAVANGCYLVGHYLENGIGVDRNNMSMEEATLWYHKAAYLGHRRALKRLRRLSITQANFNQGLEEANNSNVDNNNNNNNTNNNNNNTKNRRRKSKKKHDRHSNNDNTNTCQLM
ncbi:hypothetical protein INT45_005680 [Circinella minor]|uniref:Uncharacterized protein n=1 Tax=Circinella minor TaxID=1195481 RepID=A0A8H7S407_9FUNG|nr:hypothetical protein INT45_005680 [Circinella minor]